MSFKDKRGKTIVTLDDVWSFLFKVAMVLLPILVSGFIAFVMWVITQIHTLQTNQATLTERVKNLAPASHKAASQGREE